MNEPKLSEDKMQLIARDAVDERVDKFEKRMCHVIRKETEPVIYKAVNEMGAKSRKEFYAALGVDCEDPEKVADFHERMNYLKRQHDHSKTLWEKLKMTPIAIGLGITLAFFKDKLGIH